MSSQYEKNASTYNHGIKKCKSYTKYIIHTPGTAINVLCLQDSQEHLSPQSLSCCELDKDFHSVFY